MTSYNSTLQSNNTDLQEVLQILQNKASGGETVVDDISKAMITRTISSIEDNTITIIEAGAFACAKSLISVNFPACTTINGFNPAGTREPIGAFMRCSNLKSISFPVCTSIGAGTFDNCTSLTTVSFPVCTSIGDCAFNGC